MKKTISPVLPFWGLWVISVLVPILDHLERDPVFFVVYRLSATQIALTVLCLALVIPLTVGFVIMRLPARIRESLIQLIVFLLFILFCLPVGRKVGISESVLLLALSVAGAFLLTRLYSRSNVLRAFARFLCFGALLMPVRFFMNPQVMRLMKAEPDFQRSSIPSDPTYPSIIMVIFDELPGASLLNPDGSVDQQRFPNFAKLARDSVSFTNYSTIAGSTYQAVPTILSGNYPRRADLLPWSVDFPTNLFTLFSSTHRLHVYEQLTALCPESICQIETADATRGDTMTFVQGLFGAYLRILFPTDVYLLFQDPLGYFRNAVDRMRGRLVAPDGGQFDFGGFMAKGKWSNDVWLYSSFLSSIYKDVSPALHFVHVTLPHYAYRFLPSGKKYMHGADESNFIGVAEFDHNQKTEAAIYLQRHLLQLQYVDNLLGKLIERLERKGMYKDTVLVVTADHGNAFRPAKLHRIPDESSAGEIMVVPLYIKAPGLSPKLDRRNAQSVDLLPTLIGLSQVKYGGTFDGSDLFSPHFAEPKAKYFFQHSEIGVKETEFPPNLSPSEGVHFKQNLFGENDFFTFSGCESLYGQNADKIEGVPVNSWINDELQFSTVDLNSNFIPSLIEGRVSIDSVSSAQIGILVNRSLRAVLPVTLDRAGLAHFSAMVPEESFIQGKNVIEVLKLSNDCLPQTIH